MKVDPESYKVEADGVHCTAEPAEMVAVGQSVCLVLLLTLLVSLCLSVYVCVLMTMAAAIVMAMANAWVWCSTTFTDLQLRSLYH